MRYLLAILSHGSPSSPTVIDAATSFLTYCDPWPTAIVSGHDGPGEIYEPTMSDAPVICRRLSDHRSGFCNATRSLWWLVQTEATLNGCGYVLWLEHDFELRRVVDLSAAARILNDPGIAQVSLMRQSFAHEVGGIVPQDERIRRDGWFEHRRYFTTNPSLMRLGFMRENPWPRDGAECEGRFGLRLRERGYRFAVLGDGEPWVEHVGQLRTGEGY